MTVTIWIRQPLLSATDTRFENAHQCQDYKYQHQRAHTYKKGPAEQKLASWTHQRTEVTIPHIRPEIHAEIEPVPSIKEDRLYVPVPIVCAKPAHEAQANPKLNTVFAQSSFPIYVAVFVQLVHR
jgi:hypothetical protein